MNHRTFNLAALTIFGSMVVGLFTLNLMVDPFGVLGTSNMPDGPSSNERYLKIEHLNSNPNQYKLLMFGSSRSGMTDPAWVRQATGLETYNLTVFSGKPTDIASLYRAYRRTNEAPKEVMIGLDAMSFLSEPDKSDLSRRHHPYVDGAGTLSYWLDYLLAPSLLPSIEKVNAQSEPSIAFDWERGTYALLGYEKQIANDHAAYIEKTFGTWKPRSFSSSLDSNQWDVFSKWLETLAADQVRVTVFLQPMHRQWKSRMSPLMPEMMSMMETLDHWVDLSNVGSDADEQWYEQRHYRASIAREVVDALYADRIQRIASGNETQ